MKARPILFSGAMVRALLNGRKTQTRRAMKPQPRFESPFWRWEGAGWPEGKNPMIVPCHSLSTNCPYGQPGDLLWVREKFIWQVRWEPGNKPDKTGLVPLNKSDPFLTYAADLAHPDMTKGWRPSIHMPRTLSRLMLEITSVSVERLQDISESDAQAEGVEPLDFEREERCFKICPKCGGTRLHDGLGQNYGVIHDIDCTACDTHKKRYQHLWESINGPGSWTENPWVWVIEFKMHKQNVDAFLKAQTK